MDTFDAPLPRPKQDIPFRIFNLPGGMPGTQITVAHLSEEDGLCVEWDDPHLNVVISIHRDGGLSMTFVDPAVVWGSKRSDLDIVSVSINGLDAFEVQQDLNPRPDGEVHLNQRTNTMKPPEYWFMYNDNMCPICIDVSHTDDGIVKTYECGRTNLPEETHVNTDRCRSRVEMANVSGGIYCPYIVAKPKPKNRVRFFIWFFTVIFIVISAIASYLAIK